MLNVIIPVERGYHKSIIHIKSAKEISRETGMSLHDAWYDSGIPRYDSIQTAEGIRARLTYGMAACVTVGKYYHNMNQFK